MLLVILTFALLQGQIHVLHQQNMVLQMSFPGLISTRRQVPMLALLRHQEMMRNSKKLELTKGYIVCNMIEGSITPLHTPEELKAMGFHLIVHPLTTLYASARSMLDVLEMLKENGSTRGHLDKMATFAEFNQLVNLDSWFELEARYSDMKNRGK